jgi:uncharacterized protein
MHYLQMKSWSPYVVGALIGVLSWFAFVSVDRPIGVSTAIAKTAGMVERTVAGEHVAANAYFTKFRPAVDWEWMLVIGLGLGAFVASRLAGDKPAAEDQCPAPARFAWLRGHRYIAAFCGGVILMYGARLAGGCTSGHGISGSLQLALSGWIFFACVFASGIVTAAVLYRKEDSRG